MRIDAPIITGSFSLNGSTLGSLTSVATTGSNTFLGGQSATSFAGDQLTANDRAYLRRIDGIAGTTIEVIAPISASAGITGSTNFDTIVNKPTLVSGSSQVIDILSSLNSATASFTPKISNLESKSSSVDISISNINSVTASNIARLNNLETKSASVDISITNINSYTSSQDTKNTTLGSYTGSNDTKWTSIGNLTGSYATTGSNTFYGTQVFSGSVFIATDLIVQGSSSIQYISASSVSIGTNIVNLNTAAPSVRYAGISVQDSGSSAGVTGSMLWDSLCNRWIYSNPSTIGYSGGMLLSGPRASTLGTEATLTCNYIAKSGGGDHLYDSCISDDGTTVCVNGNFVGTGTACFGGNICANVNSNTFGNASSAGRALIVQAGSGNQAIQFKNCWGGDGTLYAWGNATAFHYGFNTYSCSDVLFIANDGNVGIGTNTVTDGKLVISQAAVASTYKTYLALVSTLSYTDTSMGIDFINRGIGGDLSGRISVIREGSAVNYGMAFGTNLSNVYCQRLYISSCGCVGIGCNTPGYTLDVKGSGHFTSAGATMLIESTQPTNSHTLKIVQCADGGNGNTDQGLVVQINGADGTSNIANFYDYNNGTAISRVRFLKNGVTCFQNTVCSPTFAGSAVRGSSNLDLNGNSGYLTLRTGDTTRLFVGSTGGVSVGAVSDPGVNNFIVAGTICSAGQVKGSSLFAGGPACGSGWRLGGSTYNTAYESDGLWGTNSTPNFIQSPVGYGIRIGYTDNGSGLYGAAYGFDVSYKDGLNNCIDYNAIIMRNSGQGTTPFRVTSYGNIYGTSKNFRIKHPIPSMNNTHYLIHTSIEGPQADLIYRGKVQLVNGKAEVNIDLASRMTDGTFEALCQDIQSYTTNESGWSLTKSYVVENILHIEAQDETSDDIISWLVIGERNDDGIKNSAITDENGHVIVEELKPEEGL